MSRLTSLGGPRPLGIALVVSTLLGAASAASAQDYQPLAVGDVRTYENGGAFGAVFLARSTAAREPADQEPPAVRLIREIEKARMQKSFPPPERNDEPIPSYRYQRRPTL